MAIWDPQYETIDRERLGELQLARLRDMLARVRECVPLYRERLGVAGCESGDLTSLDDVAGLPFTEKTDFRDNYPYGLFAVPMGEVVEIHSSSGTTGKAVVGGYTRADSRDVGRARLAGSPSPPESTTATSPRSPSGTACSPAASACTTGCSEPAWRCCPSVPGTPRASSSS